MTAGGLRASLGVTSVLLAAACARPVATRGATAPRPVQVWVTTGDRTKLLHREPDITLDAMAKSGTLIAVDDAHEYQSIVGFGAALTDASAWLLMHKLTPAARDSLLRDLFGTEPGAGFSFLRLDMGASDFALRDYSYDDPPSAGGTDTALAWFSIDPDRAETIPILRQARRINPDLAIMATPWSAPAWMKTTNSMIKGSLRPEYYDVYARYFARFIEAYAAEGIPVSAITVQNEPHFEPENYPGMSMRPGERAEFVGHHLGPLLAQRGLATRILDWDHNWDQPDSPLAVLGDSTARTYIAGVAWHCYGGDVAAQVAVHDAFPSKDAYFTECSGGNWAPNFSDNLLWTTRVLVVQSVRNWARGVLMWNLALDENHGPHTGGCGDCRGVVTVNSTTGAITRNEEYYALAHAGAFVRPGARRIQSSGVAPALDHVAFRNPDGSRVLVAVNSGAAAMPIVIAAGARMFAYTLPAATVVTFRWRP